jgi:hypothetical protein
MVNPNDILDEIINHLEPEEIPAEYIKMARITDFDGNDRILTGDDLKKFMENPFEYAAEARIVLDINRIRKAIISQVNAVYDAVNDLYAKQYPNEPR